MSVDIEAKKSPLAIFPVAGKTEHFVVKDSALKKQDRNLNSSNL